MTSAENKQLLTAPGNAANCSQRRDFGGKRMWKRLMVSLAVASSMGATTTLAIAGSDFVNVDSSNRDHVDAKVPSGKGVKHKGSLRISADVSTLRVQNYVKVKDGKNPGSKRGSRIINNSEAGLPVTKKRNKDRNAKFPTNLGANPTNGIGGTGGGRFSKTPVNGVGGTGGGRLVKKNTEGGAKRRRNSADPLNDSTNVGLLPIPGKNGSRAKK